MKQEILYKFGIGVFVLGEVSFSYWCHERFRTIPY